MLFEKGKSGNDKTKFKPGESGNPNGRPKIPDLKDLLESEVGEAGFKKITEALFKQAKSGNVKAIQEVFDRYYGKTIQKTETSGELSIKTTKDLTDEELAAIAANQSAGGR